MQDVKPRRPRVGRSNPLILGIFVTLLLTLAACGNPPQLPAVPTPTEVIIFPTIVPHATPAIGTEAITDTGVVTGTEVITGTSVITGTGVVTKTDVVTGTETEGIPSTQAVTDSATLTGGQPITGAGQITGTDAMTGTSLPDADTIRRGSEAAEDAQIAADATVSILQPTSNALVPLNFTVVISYTGLTMAAANAGEGTAGQLFLLVDSNFIPAGDAMPTDNLHVPLVDGATSVELGLTPGSHVLRLQYVDAGLVALEGEQFQDEIVVNVDEAAVPTAVRIVTPTDGAIVPPIFDVVMAAAGLIVAPAGASSAGTGHFHIILNAPFIAPGEIIPNNETYLHFGQGQLQGTVSLPVGDHLLRLQFADSEHRALEGSQYHAEVRVRVEEDAPATRVMFVKPSDGATVTSPFSVVWAASGLIIEQAGQSIRPGAGHLHLLINEDFVAAGELIPPDDTHLHFGRGQTATELTLPAGEYTLRLQMANGGHLAQDGEHYQDELQVTVR